MQNVVLKDGRVIKIQDSHERKHFPFIGSLHFESEVIVLMNKIHILAKIPL